MGTHPSSEQQEKTSIVTVRSTVIDAFQGLKGHEYIEARKLNRPVQRVQTSAHVELAPMSGEK